MWTFINLQINFLKFPFQPVRNLIISPQNALSFLLTGFPLFLHLYSLRLLCLLLHQNLINPFLQPQNLIFKYQYLIFKDLNFFFAPSIPVITLPSTNLFPLRLCILVPFPLFPPINIHINIHYIIFCKLFTRFLSISCRCQHSIWYILSICCVRVSSYCSWGRVRGW